MGDNKMSAPHGTSQNRTRRLEIYSKHRRTLGENRGRGSGTGSYRSGEGPGTRLGGRTEASREDAGQKGPAGGAGRDGLQTRRTLRRHTGQEPVWAKYEFRRAHIHAGRKITELSLGNLARPCLKI